MLSKMSHPTHVSHKLSAMVLDPGFLQSIFGAAMSPPHNTKEPKELAFIEIVAGTHTVGITPRLNR